MRAHTDSETIEYHEDGSWTTTTIVTGSPMTRGQKATAVVGLSAIMLAPALPLVFLATVDKVSEKLEARRERKAQKNN